MRVTTKEVAERAGVHKSTVSRALRDDPRILKATRERLKKVAREMGYRPDPALSIIAANRWQTRSNPSGAMLAYLDFQDAKQPERPECRYLREASAGLGYGFEKIRYRAYRSLSAMMRVLRARGIQGLILGPMHKALHWERAGWEDFSAVNCIPGHFSPPFDAVLENDFAMVSLCVEKVREAGYGRVGIAVLRHDFVNDDDRVRYAAASLCNNEAPAKLRVPPYAGGFGDCEGLRAWYKKHRPEAVVGFNRAVQIWLEMGGWESPRDHAFATLRGTARDAYAGNWLDYGSLADATVDMLDSMLRHGHRGLPKRPRRVLIEPLWQDGPTCPPAKSPARGHHGDSM